MAQEESRTASVRNCVSSAAVLLLILVPRFYDGSVRPVERPLRDMYRALFPYRGVIQVPDTVIVTPGFGGEHYREG